MPSIKNTICGALVLSCAITLSLAGQASLAQDSARTSEQIYNQPTNSEEEIGGQTYEVSKIALKASPEHVQEVLDDYQHAPSFFENVRKCQVLSSNGPTKDVAYSVVTMSTGMTFNYVLQVTESKGFIAWHRLKGAFKRNEGYWRLEPLDEGRGTLVTYAKFVDGGFFFPQMLVRREVKSSMATVMTDLKRAAETQNKVAMNASKS